MPWNDVWLVGHFDSSRPCGDAVIETRDPSQRGRMFVDKVGIGRIGRTEGEEASSDKLWKISQNNQD
jgi:hypothetical protein